MLGIACAGVIMALMAAFATPVFALEESADVPDDVSAQILDAQPTAANPEIVVRPHVANLGWLDSVASGEVAGTTGRGLALEAVQIDVGGLSEGSSLELSGHVSQIGWQDWQTGFAGSTGRALALEALRVRLTGPDADSYDVWYRVHASNLGWLGWACNGAPAGSTGLACQLEAVEVIVAPKGAAAPGDSARPFVEALSSDAVATSYSQVDESTSVLVVPDFIEQLAASGVTDISVVATMSYKGVETRRVESTCSLAECASHGMTVDMGTYGPFMVTVTYRSNGLALGAYQSEVGVTASTYNLAPLSATFPVVLYSLSYWDISNAADGSTIPSIIMLDRPSAYDWDALPSGMYGMPYLTDEAIRTSSNYDAFADYIGDLYRLDPSSHFNLYLNDITCSCIHPMIYANGIPQGSYSIRLLSDGSATYLFTNEAFACADPEAKQNELVQSWERARDEAYASGRASSDYGFHDHWDSMYAVLAVEPGSEWWMTRTNLFTSGDDNAFASQIASNPGVIQKNIASMLTALEERGPDTVDAFVSLYDFNDGYFDDAASAGKQVMLLLGTYVQNETDFEAYADITKLYYGDAYEYYYKGHPNTPTGLHPEKQQQLDSMGITDVDSSIAAELILFFNPDVVLSGYGSSTFNSATPAMAGGLFAIDKATALSSESGVDYSGIDWFASPITEDTDPDILALCPEGATCHLMEFSDEVLAGSDFDIAIFNDGARSLTYYALTDDGYVPVRTVEDANIAVSGSAHVSDIGWLKESDASVLVGTTGQARQLEAFTLNAPQLAGPLTYEAHVEDIGWQGRRASGEIAGTTGEGRAVEAVCIELSDEDARSYDVWYRAHVSNVGWQQWVCNGQVAGTTGQSLPMEAFQVLVLPKGSSAPDA
ncbi:hypothetical protein [Collinsella sp. An2]|uniref:hypothetical protein n=1 Tax=Collinsella sp. An2 TaxID=1965585 RepID=UPI000B3A5044|nr:hypothetical protein [Collinsella sp. An2]OUP10055.1 hypothetical protein B5F33_03080 [Collinsella sp. An2]